MKQVPEAMHYGLFSNRVLPRHTHISELPGTEAIHFFPFFLFYWDAFLSLPMEKSQSWPLPVFVFFSCPTGVPFDLLSCVKILVLN